MNRIQFIATLIISLLIIGGLVSLGSKQAGKVSANGETVSTTTLINRPIKEEDLKPLRAQLLEVTKAGLRLEGSRLGYDTSAANYDKEQTKLRNSCLEVMAKNGIDSSKFQMVDFDKDGQPIFKPIEPSSAIKAEDSKDKGGK